MYDWCWLYPTLKALGFNGGLRQRTFKLNRSFEQPAPGVFIPVELCEVLPSPAVPRSAWKSGLHR